MEYKRHNINVFIVDDSSDFRNLLKSHLRHVGVNVVGECESAIRIHQELGSREVDLIFLDINMPGVSGLDVLPQLKRDYPGVWVVMITGDSASEIVSAALKGGADAYVLKPFSGKKVKEVLDDFVKKERGVGMKENAGLTAFIVDDEPLALDLLEARLQQKGAQVERFENASDLFAVLQQRMPDILFLDIQMPGVSGLEILDKVKGQWPKQYVVIVSAESSVDNVKKAIALKSDGFLVKPVSPAKLEEALERYHASFGKG